MTDDQEVTTLRDLYTQMRSNFLKSIKDFARLSSHTIFDGLTITDNQLSSLASLQGTPVFQAFFIMDALSKTQDIEGDVCEYGVAWGRTSALIAATLNALQSSRGLWLYDSFEGLPKPHHKDEMLHDLYGLGDIGKYQGLFAVTQDYATGAVQQVGFPMERLHVCPGWIQEATLSDRSPDLISCCYLDMDFYESTKDVLKLLVDRMPSGGIAILDDYNFFTKGPRTAVVEIMEEHPGAFSLQNPYDEKFAILSHL